jgi:ubiquinone/menaquinone biosynthesis C-methylase UbiE
MQAEVEGHYSAGGVLADRIAAELREAGKNIDNITNSDLAAVDEFHIRGRRATLELGAKMNLHEGSNVLDLGSGLGGPARTLAETYNCNVTGVDLTEEFCEAANTLSGWLGLQKHVKCVRGDATDLPFPDEHFDAAMTIHVAMNIPAKDKLYSEARRVLKADGRFAVYDVIQGEGGEVYFPVPWARDASISHLAIHEEMQSLLSAAGFRILDTQDSSDESLIWFQEMAKRIAASGPPPVSFQLLFGEQFPEMARNQVRNLAERRIRTISYICEK